MNGRLVRMIVALGTLLWSAVPVTRAQDVKPAAPPASVVGAARPALPAGSFEVIDWVVLVVDPNRPNANDLTSFKSTVPAFGRGKRSGPASAEPSSVPSPVGVIRLSGSQANGEDAIDVLLNVPAGRVLGQWPQGKARANRQLWDNVSLGEAPGSRPVTVEPGHWFDTLRRGEGVSPLAGPRWSERFLMYDVELAYPNVLRVTAGDGAGAYRMANGGGAAVRDVEVYVPAEGGWRVGGVADLPPTKAPPPGPATKPAGERPAGEEDAGAPPGPLTDVFREAAKNAKPIDVKVEAKADAQAATNKPAEGPATPPATRRAAAGQPTSQPATQPAAAAAAEVIPADAWRELNVATGGAAAKPAADAVAPWRARLAGAGLPAADVDVIVATLRAHALDAEQLTVVYQIDAAELDRLLPLEVVPSPSRVTRVGLVIVRNVDPAAGERIARLIEELGDDNWDRREAAFAKLAEIGSGAKPKLTEALRHKDVEVVYRAERLLEGLATPR